MEKKKFNKRMEKLWRIAKKDLEKISKDTLRLAKKGEAYIKEVSEKGEKKLEVMGLALQRERLYYDLGKTLSDLSKSKWTDNKKIRDLLIRVKGINRKIRRLKG